VLRSEPTNERALSLLSAIYFTQEKWDLLMITAVQAKLTGATIPSPSGITVP